MERLRLDLSLNTGWQPHCNLCGYSAPEHGFMIPLKSLARKSRKVGVGHSGAMRVAGLC